MRKRGNKAGKGILSAILTAVMAFTLFAGIPAGDMKQVEAATALKNPRKDSNGVVTWDCVYFGRYPQSDATGQTKDPIKWRVLSVDGNDAFLVADTNLDAQRYNDTGVYVTWETCTMRSWLNGYGSGSNVCGKDYRNDNFIDRAFTASEQNVIKTTTVMNADNPYHNTEGGNNTQDKVFLLSYDEVTNADYGFSFDYNTSDNARERKNTAYVAKGGTIGSSNMNGEGSTDCWWLRSPGSNSLGAMYVNDYGAVNRSGINVDYYCSLAVCPALHLNLSSSNLWSYAGTVSSDGSSTGGNNPPVSPGEDTPCDTSTEGVCSENHIANLLGKSDYKHYTGCIGSLEMVIPGIKQTNMGNNTVCKDMVTQGICATNDYVLISAYCHDEEHNSVIYVMDKQTKKYLTTILLSVEDNAGLKKGNHVGGLAYGKGIIFIAGSGDNKVWKLPIEAVDCAVASGKDTYTATISKDKYISTTKASFIYWDDSGSGRLFVGHFNEDKAENNYMKSYNIYTGKEISSSKIQLPLQTQGVSFGVGSGNKKYCICSKSYRMWKASQIYVAEMKKIKDNSGYELTNWHRITAPNMSEDIQVWNQTLYNCFESAAKCYNFANLSSNAFDRIPHINTRALISTVMTKGESAKKEEIARYRMMSRAVSGTEAEQIMTEGSCGENANYCLYKDGSMVVSGQGSMEDYTEDNVPWSAYKEEILSVYVDSGVDGIGAYAFSNCSNLEKVTISEYRNADVNFVVGDYAFKNCLQLNKVELPDASYSIEDTAFDEKSEIQICSDAASIVKYCNQYDNLSLHKHHMEYKNTVRPTCLEIGYDSYVCDCGYEEIANVVEATKAHTFKEVERVEATPDEEGYIEYQCSGCSDIYYETLEYKGQESSTENPGGQKPLPETPAGQTTEKTQPEENTDTLPVIGTEVVSSAGIYKVTKSTSSKKEVTYVKPKSKNKTSVSIPDTIKISGFTYKVTSVTANALSGNKKVTKVTVGKNVTSIGKNAFKKCTKLKTVTLKSTSLKSIGSNAFYGDKNLKTITIKSSKLTSKSVGKNAFKGTNKKLTIKVPKKKVSSYKKFLKKKGNSKVKVKKG